MKPNKGKTPKQLVFSSEGFISEFLSLFAQLSSYPPRGRAALPREMEHPHRQEKGWETARTQLHLTDSKQISASDVTAGVRLVGQ